MMMTVVFITADYDIDGSSYITAIAEQLCLLILVSQGVHFFFSKLNYMIATPSKIILLFLSKIIYDKN